MNSIRSSRVQPWRGPSTLTALVVLALSMSHCERPLVAKRAAAAHATRSDSFNPCGRGLPRPPPAPPPLTLQKQQRTLRAKFDLDHDGQLNAVERKAAREFLAEDNAKSSEKTRLGPPNAPHPGGFARRPHPGPGPRVSFDDVVHPLNAPPYDESTLRTLFLDFHDADWETQLTDFHGTDVSVPATLRADHAILRNVGVRFRGMSSYMMVPAGYKRSLNIELDAADPSQRWLGLRTLNLLNSHEDPTFLRAVLFEHVARHYLPLPRANLVHLVINGESWGIYVNAEQFNADFVEARFGTREGARFKVTGSPMGRGGLEYLGDDPKPYQAIYGLKSKNNDDAWPELVRLCRVLEQTPVGDLQTALEPLLDMESTLRFLALENAFINNDGYWIRASDYSLYRGPSGRFHIIPHDTNETFMPIEHAPGFGQGMAPGVKLDPLVAMDDKTKPLRSRLLADPVLQKRYLRLVRQIADEWLDWGKLSPIVEAHRSRIASIVRADVHKLDSAESFDLGTFSSTEVEGPCGTEHRLGLKPFVEQRRAYLLAHPALMGVSSE